jgi:anti-sigma factor RsiW
VSKPPWTPGPWVYTDDGRLGNVEAADGEPIAMAQMRTHLGAKDPEREANARLIAAAPALAEALAGLLTAGHNLAAMAECEPEAGEPGSYTFTNLHAWRQLARDALAALAAAGWPEGGGE